MPMPENLPEKMRRSVVAFNEIGWIMPLVGVAEIIGGLLIIIPKTRALGALIILPVMFGVTLTNVVQDSSGLPLVVVLWAILIWIMVNNRRKYLPLVG